jgi:hypothetical protein
MNLYENVAPSSWNLRDFFTFMFTCSRHSKRELIASYRTTPGPTVASWDASPHIELIPAENPYHWGKALYCDHEGRLILNDSYLFGFSDLGYVKPKWTGVK